VTAIRGEVAGTATDTGLAFVLENTSRAACQLAGYPDLALLDGTGNVVGTAVPDALGGDGGPMIPGPSPSPSPSTGSARVILRPGGHAWVWLHYGSSHHQHGSRCPSVEALRVGAAHQHGWLTVRVSFRPCDRVDVTVFTPGP